MSAEGKKKRGASGLTKAKTSPFRLNGWAPDWAARSVGAYRSGRAASGGSVTMRGILGGVVAERLGYPMYGMYDHLLEHAQSRCTHPLLVDDVSLDIELAQAA